MGTTSTIAIKKIDGRVKGIYCNFDGYIHGVGCLLLSHYTDVNKVKELISLGSISYLSESIECPIGHSFDNPVMGYTVAYHRDRTEDLVVRYEFDYDSFIDKHSAEYNYLFDESKNKWYILLDNKLKKLNKVYNRMKYK